MKKTVIFGGTFNPIHYAHLDIIQNVLMLPSTDKVLVMPTATPPHKISDNLACDADRFEMCKLALNGVKNVIVSDVELLRGGRSYTYDTLRHLKTLYPQENFALVCGGDMIVSFKEWYKYKEILKMTEIIAIRRVGIDDTRFDEAVRDLINDGAVINVLKNHVEGISSTEIRENITNDEYLLKHIPQCVLQYIRDNDLYGDR